MNRIVGALALTLALAGCQSGNRAGMAPSPLGANGLACRKPETIAALHASAERFQRLADDEMASGNCRVFAASHPVRDRQTHQGLRGFVDPATGYRYWLYGAG